MRKLSNGLLVAMLSTQTMAQEVAIDCDALYQEYVEEYPVNLEECVPSEPTYTLRTCEPPHFYDGDIPTTHLILAIDASGSMAGRVGGETKMAVAQREALAFLNDVHDDVNVALVVYGHKGNNQDTGRAESCAASEMIHSFDTNRADLEQTIMGLSPTGWTPLGGVLEYAGDLIDAIPAETRGADSAAVVYLISDGEETCDGDPVGAATALANAGIQASVNTIGFAVDTETAEQLEAIAAAGGGRYYPADSATALQQQLGAIREAEASLARYDYCVLLNTAQVSGAHQRVVSEMTQCWSRNDPTRRQVAILTAMNAAEREGQPEAVCRDVMFGAASVVARENGGFIAEQIYPLQDVGTIAVEEYIESMRLLRRE